MKGYWCISMRKILKVVLLVAILILCYSTTVCATTNEELINYVTKKFNINGTEVGLSSENCRKVERYLTTYPVDSQEADQIVAKVNEGVSLMKAENVTDPSKLSAAKKEELLSIAQEATKIAGADLTFNSTDHVITIYKDGEVFDQAKADSSLVQTGSDNSYVLTIGASVAIIAVAGLAVLMVKKYRA